MSTFTNGPFQRIDQGKRVISTEGEELGVILEVNIQNNTARLDARPNLPNDITNKLDEDTTNQSDFVLHGDEITYKSGNEIHYRISETVSEYG
jgi:hypothetical protein